MSRAATPARCGTRSPRSCGSSLNTLYLAAQEWTPEVFKSPGVFAFFAELKDSFYQLAGIRRGTMPRDLAYDFMELGIMLERAEDVSRMLDVKYHFLLPRLEDVGGAIDLLQWAAVLRSASGLEAYRKRYGGAIRVEQRGRYPALRSDLPALGALFGRAACALSSVGSPPARRTLRRLPRGRQAARRDPRQPARPRSYNRDCISSCLHLQDSCAEISELVFEEYLKAA